MHCSFSLYCGERQSKVRKCQEVPTHLAMEQHKGSPDSAEPLPAAGGNVWHVHVPTGGEA